MEQVLLTEWQQKEQPSPDGTSRGGRTSSDLMRLLSLARAPDGEPGVTPPQPPAGPDKPDWSASLDLVRRVVGALRASAERVQSMEARTQAVLQHAAKELEGARARIEALEARLRAAESREKQCQARAKEAEDWLRRIHDVVAEELPSGLLGTLPDTPPGPAGPA